MDISNKIKTEIPQITFITPLLQDRSRKKRCSCKQRRFIIDTTNREILCSVCGCVIDPFEAILEVAENNEIYDNYLLNQYNCAQKLEVWFKNNRIPIEIKKLVEDYRFYTKNGSLPECPHCGQNFKFSDIKTFSNPKLRGVK